MQSVTEGIQTLEREIDDIYNKARIRTAVVRHLARFKSLAEDYLRRATYFSSQRMILEMGSLTEGLITDDDIKTIERKTARRSVTAAWLLRHIKIEYLTIYDGKLIFSVDIPLLENSEYRSFKLHYFAVNYETETETTLSRRLNEPEHVAINTNTGSYFVIDHEKCIGFSPILCLGVTEITGNSCIKALLSSESKLLELCRWRFEKTEPTTVKHFLV